MHVNGNWKLRHSFLTVGAALLGLSTFASAQMVVDGVIDEVEYGAPIWVNETNPTGFGDNDDATIGCANGSELDALYVTIQDDVFGDPWLYLGFTGNLETNFNKLDIFLDTASGVGQNPLPMDNPDIDFGALQRMGDDGSGNGLGFDALFTANMYFTVTTGNCDGEFAEIYANFADLDAQLAYYLGTGTNGDGILSEGDNPFGIQATVDNSNILGVTDTEALGAAEVTTGWELAIPMYAIGDPAEDILVCAFINGSGHDWISSQVVGGGLWGADNLADPRYVDFAALYGNQYATVDNAGPRAGAFIIHAGPLVGGEAGLFGAEGATPGGLVFWAYSLSGLGSTFVPQLNVTLDLQNPAEAGRATADGNGNASLTRPIPSQGTGHVVWLQGAEYGNVTNVIDITIQ